jgi:predicted nucleotidyltransferase
VHWGALTPPAGYTFAKPHVAGGVPGKSAEAPMVRAKGLFVVEAVLRGRTSELYRGPGHLVKGEALDKALPSTASPLAGLRLTVTTVAVILESAFAAGDWGTSRESCWLRLEVLVELEARLLEKREEILGLARRHGMRRVSVFGSAAKGEGSKPGDVDLLVDVEEGRSLFDLIAFKLDVEALLGCEVDVVSRDGVSPHLAEYVFGEEVAL